MINFSLKPNHFHITDNVFFPNKFCYWNPGPTTSAGSEAASTQSLCCNGFMDLKICSKQINERREEKNERVEENQPGGESGEKVRGKKRRKEDKNQEKKKLNHEGKRK